MPKDDKHISMTDEGTQGQPKGPAKKVWSRPVLGKLGVDGTAGGSNKHYLPDNKGNKS